MVLNVNVFYTTLFEISQMRCNNYKYFPLKNINTSVTVRTGNTSVETHPWKLLVVNISSSFSAINKHRCLLPAKHVREYVFYVLFKILKKRF